jgi:hypothetical protein
VKFERINLLLSLLVAGCIVRLWLMPLRSSFWIDEIATAFVARYGSAHPSLAPIAPQAWRSIYYYLPRWSEALFGFSEAAYRLPSVLAMGVALFLFARLAAKLIHPDAGWFAVVASLALRGISDEASDARPYALGTCLAAAAVFFLVRWLESARWRDALVFGAFAALVWRVHLLYWPFYLVLGGYALVRLFARDTRVSWRNAALVFALLAATRLPVARDALNVLRDAKTHVIVPPPTALEFVYALKVGFVASCAAGAWLLSRLLRWREPVERPARTSLALFALWWLVQPLCLFAFSSLTRNSVFVARYISLLLPGAALTATALTAMFIPSARWKPLAAVLGAGVLLLLGQWRQPWPTHHNSDWRGAARSIDELGASEMPIICPSPFIEARPPVWRPDYPLPGFLYAHLSIYPTRGHVVLFPYDYSGQAGQFASKVLRDQLRRQSRFVIFGQHPAALFWNEWFAKQADLNGWRSRQLGSFGDVDATLFERPGV